MDESHKVQIPDWSDKRLLLVEDDSSCIVLVEEYLHGSGIQLTFCSTGEEVTMLKSKLAEHDLILLDIQLQDVDGLNLCKKLSETVPEIPIIVHTAINEPDILYKCYQNGANEVLLKPVSFKMFYNCLQSFIDK